ncbi:MAG: hypothetical protein JSR17_08725 [Proteobacteria bacterium]|nr:hypothetical protein [Pseudomonadota bacterium]
MQGQYQIEDPEKFLFLQDTVSPTFSTGANGGPGKHLKAVAAEIQAKPDLAKQFPPLKVFHVDDPETEEACTFSLDTRRLLTFRMAKVHAVKTTPASFREIRQSTWKMTSEEGGIITPGMTSTPNKDAYPHSYTTLYKLRSELERLTQQGMQHCQANNIVGEAREAYLDQTIEPAIRAAFHLR